MTRDGF